MKPFIKQTSLAAAIALTIAGCGGGGGDTDVAGIGGSGFVSSGQITGFGSVYVNGVRFETDTSSFDIEGDTSGTTQANLSIGMIVKVYGTINADGTTGTATSIVFDDDLQGPVVGLTKPTPDTATFTVLGITVNADRIGTNFEAVTFDTLADGNNIEISGFFDSAGVLHASRIEHKTGAEASEAEIKGNITGLTGSTFTINGVNVDASSATLEGLANGLQDGEYVEVEGTYTSGNNTITATKVESESFDVEDTDEFEVEGYITNFNSNSDFKINGISIDASNATIEPAGTVLANDLKVEAEGQIVNNVLVADEISLRGGEIKVEAPVYAVDKDNNTITVAPTPDTINELITIEVGNETEFRDEVNDTEPFNLQNISTSMHIAIEGYELQNGNVFADKVVVIDGSDGVVVKGIVESINEVNPQTVKVLGATFTGVDGTTTYEQNDTPLANWAAFEATLTVDQTKVEVKDFDSDGIANELESE